MNNSAWIGLVGALGGVALTGIIGLVTAVLNNRWQERAAARARTHSAVEQWDSLRRDAYVRYLVAAQRVGELIDGADRLPSEGETVFQYMRSLGSGSLEATNAYDEALRHARLVAGDDVYEAIRRYDDWLTGAALRRLDGDQSSFGTWDTVEEPLVSAMRAEQQRPTAGTT
jgi:hypothetical protein